MEPGAPSFVDTSSNSVGEDCGISVAAVDSLNGEKSVIEPIPKVAAGLVTKPQGPL
jgi:hypothetical protein